MTNPCPQCGFVDDPLQSEIARICDRFNVRPSDRVRESLAAEIVGKSLETLRGYRKGLHPDEAQIFFRRDAKGGIWYHTEDLAAFNIGLKK
ncbi:hypothetical protein [Hyphococcus sp.]|uniref:hypothetical protein n=1 Tax=Hyphococcus sp. TaxID=2038636 RepID=UPI003CCC17B4